MLRLTFFVQGEGVGRFEEYFSVLDVEDLITSL